MKSFRYFAVTAAALLTPTILLCVSVPVILLPSWTYQAIYGWRYPKLWSCGDAKLLDQGPGAAISRYRIEFDQISIGEATSRDYRVCGLPHGVPLFVGIAVKFRETLSAQDARRTIDPETQVAMELRDSSDKVVIRQTGRLRSWIWSDPIQGEAFVYQGGLFFPDHPRPLQLAHNDNRIRIENPVSTADIRWWLEDIRCVA